MPSTDTAHHTTDEREVQPLDRVVIRFAGDSGDGMQLTGDRFTAESAIHGNDISTSTCCLEVARWSGDSGGR